MHNRDAIMKSIRHPLLKSAQDRMTYRLDVGNFMKDRAAFRTYVENGLVAQVPNVGNWINEVAQIQQAHQGYNKCYEVMHYRTLNKQKKVPKGLEANPIGYTASAVHFINFNRNVAAHQV